LRSTAQLEPLPCSTRNGHSGEEPAGEFPTAICPSLSERPKIYPAHRTRRVFVGAGFSQRLGAFENPCKRLRVSEPNDFSLSEACLPAFRFKSASVSGPTTSTTRQVPTIWPEPLLISPIGPRILVREPRISQVLRPARMWSMYGDRISSPRVILWRGMSPLAANPSANLFLAGSFRSNHAPGAIGLQLESLRPWRRVSIVGRFLQNRNRRCDDDARATSECSRGPSRSHVRTTERRVPHAAEEDLGTIHTDTDGGMWGPMNSL
jgi:hypothetical protein